MNIYLNFGRDLWILRPNYAHLVFWATDGSRKFIRIEDNFFQIENISVDESAKDVFCELSYKPSWASILELKAASDITYCYDKRYSKVIH